MCSWSSNAWLCASVKAADAVNAKRSLHKSDKKKKKTSATSLFRSMNVGKINSYERDVTASGAKITIDVLANPVVAIFSQLQ